MKPDMSLIDIPPILSNFDFYSMPKYMQDLSKFLASDLIYVLAGIFVIFMIWTFLKKGLNIVKLSIFALPTIFILSRIASFLIKTNRPFVEYNLTPVITHTADNGFPSDHTLAAVSMALIIFSESRILGSIFLLGAALIGYGRFTTNLHNPIDIIASFVIAIIGIIIARYLMRKVEGK
jgi:undecaprenyl-diphosphatase